MRTFLFLAVLIIVTKYGNCKNLDEIEDTRTTNGPQSASSSPTTLGQSTQSTSSVKSTLIRSTPSTPLPENQSLLPNSEEFSNSSFVILKTPDANISFVENLSNQIRMVLKHFQDTDPIGIPGDAILPEPMPAENVSVSMIVANGFFHNITIRGLNNFSIDVVNTFLDKMEVYVILKLKTVTALGNYTVSNLLLSSEGPFNITFTNVTAAGTVGLFVDEGKIRANKSIIDIAYEQIEVDLVNVSSIVRPFLNTGGSRVFDAEKPLILESINKRLISELNRRLDFIPKIPPLTKLSPVDLAILEARKFVRDRFEPFVIDKVFDFDNSFLNVHVGPVYINGVSRFARVGNLTLEMVNQTIDLRIRIITQRLVGNCKWYYDIGKVGVTRHGQSNFSVSHLQFEARVLQNIDSRKSPRLEKLDIETGPVIVKMDGLGDFDYLVEMVSKVLPKMLRHLIIDSLEETLKEYIQIAILNNINVEQVYEDHLPDIKKYISSRM